jgi:hypothetical protein
VLSLQRLIAAMRREINLKVVVATCGKNAVSDVNIQRQQLVVFLKRDEKLRVTDPTIVSLVDNKDFTGIPPPPRAGQEQKQTQGSAERERYSL